MSEVAELPTNAYTLAVDEHAVWLQANRYAGSTSNITPGYEASRDRLLEVVRPYVARTAMPIYMKPQQVSGFVDLDELPHVDPLIRTDGFITSNPNYILQANPADCGEVAISGYSETKDRPAIALLHVNRVIAGQGSQRDALDYFFTKYDVQPDRVRVRMSPSARAESYVFPEINEAQQTADEWRPYLSQDKFGNWHVDFHGKTVDDLVAIGILLKHMSISPVDTIAAPDYFSMYNHTRGKDIAAGNGLFYALRRQQSDN